MIPFLVAIAEAMPAVVKFVDTIQAKEKKASDAASVATDPKAPADVKAAAKTVAETAIDDKAKAEKAALAAVTGKPTAPSGGGATTALVIGVIALAVLSGRRRRR